MWRGGLVRCRPASSNSRLEAEIARARRRPCFGVAQLHTALACCARAQAGWPSGLWLGVTADPGFVSFHPQSALASYAGIPLDGFDTLLRDADLLKTGKPVRLARVLGVHASHVHFAPKEQCLRRIGTTIRFLALGPNEPTWSPLDQLEAAARPPLGGCSSSSRRR